jgi:magnesium transporter
VLTLYQIVDGRLVVSEDPDAPIMVFTGPEEAEKKRLMSEYQIDEYDINAALDPNEPARIEFDEEDYHVLILNVPKRYSSHDNFLFRISSFGMFICKGKLIILFTDHLLTFEGRLFSKIRSVPHFFLKVIYRNILHFEQHLQVIQKIADELEGHINQSMENKQLLNMFNLEKSLVYYLQAVSSNGRIIDKMRTNAAKLKFSEQDMDFLDDVVNENGQCIQQAHIFSEVFTSLMDAWASIINNNLNVFIKKLTLATICIMLPTLILSFFSMNVPLPFDNNHGLWPFWIITGLAVFSSAFVFALWRWKKW